MAHIVSRRGYLSLEESYRDPITGKPRKRYLRYIGKRASDPQARYEQMLDTAERKAEEIADQQRAQFGETGAERAQRLKDEARFSPQAFLQESVVKTESAMISELDKGQPDEGESGEADSEGEATCQ